MKQPAPYNSAVSATDSQITALPFNGRHQFKDGSVVLRWDFNDGRIPDDYRRCDVLWLEPPWPKGVEVFDRRAGVRSPRFSDMMQTLSSTIWRLKKPTAVVVGKTHLKHLHPPDHIQPLILNGLSAELATYGLTVKGARDVDAIADLAARFNMIGDFFCGYGRTGRIVKAAGKRFVLSDYNAVCVGHIKDTAETWEGWAA